MRDVLGPLLTWWQEGHTVGMATVVATFRSAPRPPGASMVVGPQEVLGSVSGGCVEGAVYELAQEVVASGQPVLKRYGVSDEDAFAVGLTCGGILDVFVEPVSQAAFPQLAEVAADIEQGRPVAVATLIDHPDRELVGRRLVVRPDPSDGHGDGPVDGPVDGPGEAPGEGLGEGLGEGGPSGGGAGAADGGPVFGSERFDGAVIDDARGLLAAGRSETLTYGPDGERRGEGARVFVSSYAPKPRMLVFGAIDFAAAVARMGSFLGYHVTVCDARPVFATHTRFPDADEVVVSWPHTYLAEQQEAGRIDDRTVLAVLTHDPKFDVPLLKVAVRLPQVGYIGAMGSRRTHADRIVRLREVGLSDEEIARISSPIGLDLGARTPEETAVSIAAEIIAVRWGGAGERLTHSAGAIHPHPDVAR